MEGLPHISRAEVAKPLAVNHVRGVILMVSVMTLFRKELLNLK